MKCENKIQNVCIETTNAKCVEYVGELGESTKIGEICTTQHMVNEDLYEIVDEIVTDIDTELPSETEATCINYPVVAGKVTPKAVMKKHREEICSLKDRVHTLEVTNYAEMDITDFGLDFKCLVDPCGDPITNLGQLLQIMINKACNGGSTPGGGPVDYN